MKPVLLRLQLLVLMSLLPGIGVYRGAAAQQEIKPIKVWKGNFPNEADRPLMKIAPKYITNAGQLEKLWKAWRIKEALPGVDFTKEFVCVSMGEGSGVTLSTMLGDNGNILTTSITTADIRPGFRYIIATLSRKGVKTVEGKQLPNIPGAIRTEG